MLAKTPFVDHKCFLLPRLISLEMTDVPSMLLTLLDLPIVLVQDVLQHFVDNYTFKRNLRLELLLNIRLVNSVFPIPPLCDFMLKNRRAVRR